MAERKRLAADDLVRAIRGTNPFRSNRVSSPDDVRVDVGQVHGSAFTRLTDRIDEVRAGKTASGILVVGAPGTGKSHLLGRLSRWSRDNGAAFVFLHNLQASPERMPRYVLKAAISAVFSFQHGNQGHAGLFKLLLNAMGRHEDGLDDRESVDPVDPEISAVLDAFTRASPDPAKAGLAEAAVDWMSGDEIDLEQAAALSVLAGRKVSSRLADGAAVERVLIVLARLLALDDKILVLCLDQIDNLDAHQFRSLMAFLHALIDHGQHMVVICAGVRTSIYRLRDQAIISEAAWDRVAEHVVELQEVSGDHAHRLVAARIGDFLAPFSALKPLDAPRARDPLFPLGAAWFQATFGEKLQVRPRDVVSWARDEWERVQRDLGAFEGGASKWLSSWPGKAIRNGHRPPVGPTLPLEDLIDQVVRAKVDECRSQRKLNDSSLPPDTDNLGRLTANLLAKCLGRAEYSLVAVERSRTLKNTAVTFEFFITERDARGRTVKTAVACLPGGHPTSTAKRLKKILDSPEQADHILVVTDERRAFKLGPKGEEHYRELGKRRRPTFRRIALSVDHVIELDALDSVLGMARVSDLEVEHPPGVPRPVSEGEAAEAMHRLRLFVNHPFLHELLTEGDGPVGPDVRVDPLPDAVIRGCIKDFLPWRFAAHATEVVDKLLEDHPAIEGGALLHQVTRIADMMHLEGQIKVTPIDEDRHLLWKGGTA